MVKAKARIPNDAAKAKAKANHAPTKMIEVPPSLLSDLLHSAILCLPPLYTMIRYLGPFLVPTHAVRSPILQGYVPGLVGVK